MPRTHRLTKKCANFSRGCRSAPTHLVIDSSNLDLRRLCTPCADAVNLKHGLRFRIIEQRTAFVQVLHYMVNKRELWIVRLINDVGAISCADRGLIRGETDREVCLAHAREVSLALNVPIRFDENLTCLPDGRPPDPELIV